GVKAESTLTPNAVPRYTVELPRRPDVGMTIALDILGLWSPAAILPPPDVGHRGYCPWEAATSNATAPLPRPLSGAVAILHSSPQAGRCGSELAPRLGFLTKGLSVLPVRSVPGKCYEAIVQL